MPPAYRPDLHGHPLSAHDIRKKLTSRGTHPLNRIRWAMLRNFTRERRCSPPPRYAPLGSMADDRRSLREELQRRLLEAAGSKLPTTSLGRLSRTALAGLRGGRIAWRAKGDESDPIDVDAVAALIASVGQLKGMAMKVGQLWSYLDVPLPAELRSALSVLQTHSPPMPFERVAEIVKQELSERATPLLAEMQALPAAAASIGQVHRSKLPDGIEVAVKVQYPGIVDALAADFRAAAFGTSFVRLLVPGANVHDVVSEVRRAVLEECDYQREARQQARFAALYEDHPTLTVPAVHVRFCSRRVLTTTWAEGLRFDDFLATNPSYADRNRVGEALFEFYVGSLFRHGLYNWDPHPGNYVFQSDGRVAMLDYGSTREFGRAFVRKLVVLTDAVHTDTRDALHDALVGLGMVREGEKYDFDLARDLVRSFYGPMLRDDVVPIGEGAAMSLRAVFEGKRELLKFHLPRELLFVLRIRFGVMSVLSRLSAHANWYRLERQFADNDFARHRDPGD
jgi:predicted unusual protein kinase regulating ubiquinone biosynthesis (AarF/ABC1/UbiB family)